MKKSETHITGQTQMQYDMCSCNVPPTIYFNFNVRTLNFMSSKIFIESISTELCCYCHEVDLTNECFLHASGI